jgi:hypothetical protein
MGIMVRTLKMKLQIRFQLQNFYNYPGDIILL